MIYHTFRSFGRLVLAACVVSLVAVSLSAQTPAAAARVSGINPSRVDIFAGYSYLGTQSKLQPAGIQYTSVSLGAIGSAAYFFNNHVGIEGVYTNHVVNSKTPADGAVGISAGPIYRWSFENHLSFFVHGLFGVEQLTGPDTSYPPALVESEPGTWGIGMTAGGGLDLALPFYNNLFSLRLIEADYRYSHVNFGTYAGVPTAPPAALGGTTDLNALELSSGIVVHIGHIQPPPAITYSCTVSPTTAFSGEPITVTGVALNLNPNPRKVVVYTWTSDGGVVSGKENVANVNTAAAAPGTYTVKGHVSQGIKPGQMADCSATYTVRAYDPPTISCTANPTSVNPGGSSTITSNAVSPQNRPLTYSYNATAGSIGGSTASTTLSTAGAASKPITVTCSVSDDKGHSASARTSVNVIAPPPPPPPPPPAVTPMASSLCTVSFERDATRPTRVDNEAKACLDDVVLSLQRSSDTKLALVGNEDAKEQKVDALKHNKKPSDAAQRAVNTKLYLVNEKAIDPSRILVYTGTDDGKTVTTTLIPLGATNPAAGDTPVNERAVISAPRTPPVKVVKQATKK